MLLILALWAGLAAPADLDQARALYEAGGQAYRVGRYDIAIDAFESARRIAERDVVVFALAQAYRLHYFQKGDLADLEAAVATYRRYLEIKPEGERAFHAIRHLSTIEPFLDRRRIEAADSTPAPPRARLIVVSDVPDAAARIGDGPTQPVPATFEVEPGPHVIEVQAPEHRPIRQETVAVADTAVAVILQPAPLPGRVTIRSAVDARIFVGETVVPPSSDPLELAPGRHVLVASAHGYRPLRRPFDLEPDQQLDLAVELEMTTQRVAAWSALGTSTVLSVVGLTTGLMAYDVQADAVALEARLGQGLTGADFDEHDRLVARRDDLNTATLSIGIAAAAALTAGVMLWVFDDTDTPSPFAEAGAPEPSGEAAEAAFD